MLTAIKPRRFLIVRLSAIGDCVHTLPLLNALRTNYPSSFIAWAVEGAAGKILDGHGGLDEIIRLPRHFFSIPGIVWGLTNTLRRRSFDVAIDAQGLLKSALVALLSGAPCRIGFAYPDGRELSTWLNNRLVQARAVHVVEQTLELLQPLGIKNPAVVFHLPENRPAREGMRRYLADQDLAAGFAVINPGAGWPNKLWPPERFAGVARHLAEVHCLPSLVVWAGEAEKSWAGTIVTRSAGSAIQAPPTTLPELAALCRAAQLFVSSDTGPLHIAAAVGTPCVGLFGPKPAERNGAYGPSNINVQKMIIPATTRPRSAGKECMLAIEVDDVCEACDQILASTTSVRKKTA